MLSFFKGISFERRVFYKDRKITLNRLKVNFRATKVNFNSGQLDVFKTSWHSNLQFATNFINSENTLHPLSVENKTKIISQSSGDFIKFQHSDFVTDSGQTAVPFWDAQSVAPIPAEPIIGAGFFFRTAGTSGGFIAPILATIDQSSNYENLQSEMLESMITQYVVKWVNFEENQ